MKDQIKIQVSDDGLFGRPVNPFEQYIDGGYINEDWIQFNDKHPQFPLTTPQIPKSVVMGEVVIQLPISETDHWFNAHSDTIEFFDGDIEKMKQSFGDCRQAYKVITPVPNSEPDEIIHLDINDFAISEQDLERAFCFGWLSNPDNPIMDNTEMMRRYELFKTQYLLPMLSRKHIID